jgi:HEAT repeat protein/predicted RNA methylase
MILYEHLLALANGKQKSRTKVAKAFRTASVMARETAITKAIHSKDTSIRRTAYALIGEIGDQHLAPHLFNGLQDKQSDVVQMAVWAIGKLKWRDGLSALRQSLSKGYGFKVMKTIVWSIGEIGDKTAVVYLEQLLPNASARLTEGILVSGKKLGQKTLLRLITSLDISRKEVHTALRDVSRGSKAVRNICLQAIKQTNEPKLLEILPYLTCEETEYQQLLSDPREQVRLATCESIKKSLLPTNKKSMLLCLFLEDASNKVVKQALLTLANYLQHNTVVQAIHTIKVKHPSPKLRELAEHILKEEAHLQQKKQSLMHTNHYVLETLPGLESFVEMEATALHLSLQIKAQTESWLEVTNATISELCKLHTISGIYGIIDTPLADTTTLTIQQKTLHLLPLVTRDELTRPKRRTRTTSLDWRVARAMVLCSQPTANDIVVDPTCGSGTLLLDRATFGSYCMLKGGDVDAEAVQIAQNNLADFRYTYIQQWDATTLPLTEQSVTVVLANLPFGRRVGNHEENISLYPAFIKELVRILKHGGRAVLLTQEVKLLHASLSFHKQCLKIEHEQAIEMGGLSPHIIVLQRI